MADIGYADAIVDGARVDKSALRDVFAAAETAITTLEAAKFTPPASSTPTVNGTLFIEATSNTTLTFKFKGSDGTVRTATLTLS